MATGGQQGVGERDTLHGIILPARVDISQLAMLRLKLTKFSELVGHLEKRFSESLLTVTIGFGEHTVGLLSAVGAPATFSLLPVAQPVASQLTLVSYDMVLLIRSDRYDSCFIAARVLSKWLANTIQITHSYTVFHYLDQRNLYGFKCWQDKVVGQARQQLLFIDSAQQPAWHQGSFLVVQYNQLHEQRWQELSVTAQEQRMGRQKSDGQLLPGIATGHTHAAVCRPGLGTALVWQQLPVAHLSEPGHVELLWSQDVTAICDWLTNRFTPDGRGPRDPILTYEHNRFTAAFFIPPRAWFEQLHVTQASHPADDSKAL